MLLIAQQIEVLGKTQQFDQLYLIIYFQQCLKIKVSSITQIVILLGDCGVGKTTILHNFLDMSSQPETTIGVQHHSFSRNNIKFSIWDTAGQEKYRSVVSSHYKRAKAALLIYDSSKEETLLHIDKWIEELIFQVGTKIIMILIGNKTDLQKVDLNESVQNLQDKYEISYFITTNHKDPEFKDKMNQVFDQIAINLGLLAPNQQYSSTKQIFSQRQEPTPFKSSTLFNNYASGDQEIIQIHKEQPQDVSGGVQNDRQSCEC
ncbi:unnamed protein product [Paramecium octaurelia]|uniref:Uncharacterized protein n=1 Tax=Paramecium octaurelia TaxID=43137 RepID=A0A8S1VW12_PAROT|nr:unnamed protein product [Paramecium octaurelia]